MKCKSSNVIFLFIHNVTLRSTVVYVYFEVGGYTGESNQEVVTCLQTGCEVLVESSRIEEENTSSAERGAQTKKRIKVPHLASSERGLRRPAAGPAQSISGGLASVRGPHV
ncbi:hypothetical protein E2C01_075748 [Portunus trituberculatus]|uniref:Uncharacterized protein n=1 Tax=Portunus trituberculatus TaxID=210409 RepID=A0A5B7IFU6_PORTR|nr:hypothetical protein [Portunus trituberculatus]